MRLLQRFGCWAGWLHRWRTTSRSDIFDYAAPFAGVEVQCAACGRVELWRAP